MTSQELAALYTAEAKLLMRAKAVRDASRRADTAGKVHLAAALRGKARGLSEGADQIASVSAKVRAIEETP